MLNSYNIITIKKAKKGAAKECEVVTVKSKWSESDKYVAFQLKKQNRTRKMFVFAFFNLFFLSEVDTRYKRCVIFGVSQAKTK